jgi:hypothetical protein
VNAIQKPLSGLKNVLQKSHGAFQGNGFSELHAKVDADMLLDFAIHRRQNETRRRKNAGVKTMHVHSAVSRGRVTQ